MARAAGEWSSTVRAAAPVPAPRSTKVNSAPGENGSSSAISVRRSASRLTRSFSLDFQKLTPMSDFQMAALVSSLAAASSVSGMQVIVAPPPRRAKSLGRLLGDVQALPDSRHGHAAMVHLGPLEPRSGQRGQPGDVP